jgi:hypothetical protein
MHNTVHNTVQERRQRLLASYLSTILPHLAD